MSHNARVIAARVVLAIAVIIVVALMLRVIGAHAAAWSAALLVYVQSHLPAIRSSKSDEPVTQLSLSQLWRKLMATLAEVNASLVALNTTATEAAARIAQPGASADELDAVKTSIDQAAATLQAALNPPSIEAAPIDGASPDPTAAAG